MAVDVRATLPADTSGLRSSLAFVRFLRYPASFLPLSEHSVLLTMDSA